MKHKTPEAIQQKQFIKWLRLKNIFHFAVVNEGNSNFKGNGKFIGSEMKALGKLKGVSDLVILLDDEILFIEMKRCRNKLKSGKLSSENLASKEQLNFLGRINQFKYSHGYVAYGATEAIKIVEQYL